MSSPHQLRTGPVEPHALQSLAESVIGLYKTEVIRQKGPWKGPEDVEFETLDWGCRYHDKRLLEPIGDILSAEFEPLYYPKRQSDRVEAGLN